ncbi:MAG: LysR family transcriptional regulator [Nannocystis sp.]|nr:LysR family transcriptional regulator [Nannocystis sp.]
MREVRLSDINMNLLLALEALLAEASVTRAARRLHVTQSAMSHNLAQLRELLGSRRRWSAMSAAHGLSRAITRRAGRRDCSCPVAASLAEGAEQLAALEVDHRVGTAASGLAVTGTIALAADAELDQPHDVGLAAAARRTDAVAERLAQAIAEVAAEVVGHRAVGFAAVLAGEAREVVVGAAVVQRGVGAIGVGPTRAAGRDRDDARDLDDGLA